MKAFVVIDMQCGLLNGDPPPTKVDVLIEKINTVAQAFRSKGDLVIFVQHCGESSDLFAQGKPGWKFLPEIKIMPEDKVVSKTTCDSFYRTELDSILKTNGILDVVIAGWATDFCVDTTIRSAASLEYSVTVVKDGHTAADRSHLDSTSIVKHHNRIWEQLIVPKGMIRVVEASEIVAMTAEARKAKDLGKRGESETM